MKVYWGLNIPVKGVKFDHWEEERKMIYLPHIWKKDLFFELCDICGTQIIKGRLSRGLTTCSPACNKKKWDSKNGLIITKEKNQAGKRPYYFWNAIKYECFERDHHTCQKCGTPEYRRFFDYVENPKSGGYCIKFITHTITIDLECHHILPIKDGGDNNLENLVTLCYDCHKEEHSKAGKTKKVHKTLDAFC
jgi:5-methylcytosine-specific restriction endonuclease McrA